MNTLVTRYWQGALAFVLALSLGAALPAYAQQVTLPSLVPAIETPAWTAGLRAGVSTTAFYGAATDYSEPNADFSAGAFLTYRLSPRWALQPEMAYTRRRGQADLSRVFGSARNGELTLGFVEVPLLVKASLPVQQGTRPSLMAGPYASVRLSQQASDGNFVLQNLDLAQELRRWDYGLVAGLGMESPVGRRTVSFDVRYQWGLANLFAEAERPDLRTRGFTFSVGLGL